MLERIGVLLVGLGALIGLGRTGFWGWLYKVILAIINWIATRGA